MSTNFKELFKPSEDIDKRKTERFNKKYESISKLVEDNKDYITYYLSVMMKNGLNDCYFNSFNTEFYELMNPTLASDSTEGDQLFLFLQEVIETITAKDIEELVSKKFKDIANFK